MQSWIETFSPKGLHSQPTRDDTIKSFHNLASPEEETRHCD
jgi:hypothetical protein